MNHMFHPFVEDLSTKSLEDIQNSINSLYQKLAFANRTGNQPLSYQVQMVLNSYNNEFRKRMDEMYKKQNIDKQINISNDGKS